MVQLSHPFMITGKTTALTMWTFVGKVLSLLLITLSRLLIVFLQRSECLNFLAVVNTCSDFGAQENKICHHFHFPPSIWNEVMGLDAMILIVWYWLSSQLFHSPLSPSSRNFRVPLHFLPLKWYHLHISGCWSFSWQSWFQLVIHPVWHFTWCNLHIN